MVEPHISEEKMHMMLREKNMVALSVVNKICFILSKYILALYGLMNFGGLLWFGHYSHTYNILSGILISFSGIIAIFVKKNKGVRDQPVIILLIITGCILTIERGIRYIAPADTSLNAGLPYFFITLSYAVVIMNAVAKRSAQR